MCDYLLEVADKFIKIAVELPPWSAVTVKAYNSPFPRTSSFAIEK